MGTETIYCTMAAALMAIVIVAKAVTVRLLVLAQDNIKDLQFDLMVQREHLKKAQAEKKREQQIALALKHKKSGLLKKVDPLRMLLATYEQEEALRQMGQIYTPEEGSALRLGVAV